ncbi:hypothetical protein F5Y19DRAFT_464515 [Xylariaceae sp. FL1651]|nr:hypothetical protein F5Y19DRAFT_464515 [Xylariaceae sp. FL1651]
MTTASDMGYQRPKTRQRIQKQPPALAVPNINDDAAERKRVLNVLAQRRYRKRKRQTNNCGLAKDNTTQPKSDVHDNEFSSPPDLATLAPDDTIQHSESLLPVFSEHHSESNTDAVDVHPTFAASLRATPLPAEASGAIVPSLFPGSEESDASAEILDLPAQQNAAFLFSNGTTSFPFLNTADPNTFLDLPSSINSSLSDGSDATVFSFPDSYYLPVNELTLLRGLLRIATRLRCNTTTLWELNANSPFNDGTHTALTAEQLPLTWRPTPSQTSVPHHPVIDLLPWPDVRDRLILLLSLPDDARPAAAAGPLAIVQLAYDLEDAAEGIRIWGGDPCEPTSWEIGQALFERWWFIFDRQVINQSNYWRRLRGAPTLTASK